MLGHWRGRLPLHNIKTAGNLLNLFLAGIIECETVVSWSGRLVVLAVQDGIGRVGTMLFLHWFGMSIASQLFEDVFWHREVNVTLVVIQPKSGG